MARIGGIRNPTAQPVLCTKTVDKSVDELRRGRPSVGGTSKFSALRKNYPTGRVRLTIKDLSPINGLAVSGTGLRPLAPLTPADPRRRSAKLCTPKPVNRLARLAFWPHRSRNDAAATGRVYAHETLWYSRFRRRGEAPRRGDGRAGGRPSGAQPSARPVSCQRGEACLPDCTDGGAECRRRPRYRARCHASARAELRAATGGG